MKITEVNTYTVRPRWGFVEIVTDEGFTGWGEPVLEGHCSTVLACVQEMKHGHVVGAVKGALQVLNVVPGHTAGREQLHGLVAKLQA